MPKIILLLVAILYPVVRRVTPRGSGAHFVGVPPAPEVAVRLLDDGLRLWRRSRAWATSARVGLRAWAARSVDPWAASDRGLALVAAHLDAPLPRWYARLSARARDSVATIIDGLAPRFQLPSATPSHARAAAALFTGTLALASAGVAGAVAIAAPTPAAHLRSLAAVTRSSTTTAQAAEAAATAAAAAPAPPPAPVPTQPPATEAAPAPAPPAPAPAPPAQRGALPIGKGMWIWMEDRADGGDPVAIVNRAKAYGLTHLFVRTGTLRGGFVGGPFLNRLLPVAHAAGIRVYGWDFPYLKHPGEDVKRALAAITYTTPDGHRIDGFSPDIETPSEGTNNDLEYVTAYVTWLRQNVGDNYPLIATVPNPTPQVLARGYPFAQVVAPFDAIAPMVYWMNRDPAADVTRAIAYLSQFGKPIFPVGQAYDGGPEGGPPGVPSREQLIRFMQAAERAGATGVSFWSWQHADQQAWDAVRDAAEFRLELGGPQGGLTPGMIRSYQTLLTGLGFPTPIDGVFGQPLADAVAAYQRAARLPVTGRIDEQTRAFLLAPVPAPVKPY